MPIDAAPAVPSADDAVARALNAAKLSNEAQLLDALEYRRSQILGLSFANLDLAAGLAVGHSSKCLSPARAKSPSTKTLFALLDAMQLSIVLVNDPGKATGTSWKRRDETHVRSNPPSAIAVAKSRPIVLAELARKASRARWANVPARDFLMAMAKENGS
jgi:hypothetical protein